MGDEMMLSGMVVQESLEGTVQDPLAVQISDQYGQNQVAFRAWWQVLDYVGFPFALVVYYTLPSINAMLRQLITDKLDYQVSAKPTSLATAVSSTSAEPLHCVVDVSGEDEGDVGVVGGSNKGHHTSDSELSATADAFDDQYDEDVAPPRRSPQSNMSSTPGSSNVSLKSRKKSVDARLGDITTAPIEMATRQLTSSDKITDEQIVAVTV
jgi:hypothetical protein